MKYSSLVSSDNGYLTSCMAFKNYYSLRPIILVKVKQVNEIKRVSVVLGEERFHGISSMSFGITLARPALMFNSNAIASLCTGWTAL
ncbi:hypothetical protein RIF29_40479 [Crotalaria pallida]|uniref:Uncharacterized protein n=1 Tax=Crotalaria pallida TaxID=3830 RepID=A0AAN9E3Z5_CROPI